MFNTHRSGNITATLFKNIVLHYYKHEQMFWYCEIIIYINKLDDTRVVLQTTHIKSCCNPQSKRQGRWGFNLNLSV